MIAEVRESLGVELLPSGASRRIASRPLTVPRERYQDLRHLARAAQATVFVVTVAALNVVLNAAGGATDVVVSTTLSGRQRAEWDGVIGYFANVGRIRTDLSGPLTFTDVVRRTRRSVLGLFQHQDIPFSVLDDGCQLWGEVNYKMDFYDQATVEGLARGLEWVLRAVSATPHARLSDLAAGVADALAAAGERGAATGSEHREVGTWRFDR